MTDETDVNQEQSQDETSGTSDDWRSVLPDDIREADDFKTLKSVGELGNAYLQAKKMAVNKTLTIPDTDEEEKDFFLKNGKPETFDGYSFEMPDEADDDYKDFIQGVKKAAFAGNLTDKQFNRLVQSFSEYAVQKESAAAEKLKAEHNRVLNEYRSQLGADFEPRMRDLNNICKAVSPEFAERLAKLGAGFDPVIIEGLLKLGDGFVEKTGGLVRSDGARISTMKELDARIEQLQKDPAYWDASHPMHKSKIAEVQKCFEAKFS